MASTPAADLVPFSQPNAWEISQDIFRLSHQFPHKLSTPGTSDQRCGLCCRQGDHIAPSRCKSNPPALCGEPVLYGIPRKRRLMGAHRIKNPFRIPLVRRPLKALLRTGSLARALKSISRWRSCTGFIAGEERGSYLHTACTKSRRRCNTTDSDDRYSDATSDLGDKGERAGQRVLCQFEKRCAMSARFETRGDDHVDAGRLDSNGLINGSRGTDVLDAPVAAGLQYRGRRNAKHKTEHQRPYRQHSFDLFVERLTEALGSGAGSASHLRKQGASNATFL